MKILILLSLTFFTSISTILAQEITEREFVSIKRLSEDVKKLCPPATCIVIGIGRSPTPVTTYLKAEN